MYIGAVSIMYFCLTMSSNWASIEYKSDNVQSAGMPPTRIAEQMSFM